MKFRLHFCLLLATGIAMSGSIASATVDETVPSRATVAALSRLSDDEAFRNALDQVRALNPDSSHHKEGNGEDQCQDGTCNGWLIAVWGEAAEHSAQGKRRAVRSLADTCQDWLRRHPLDDEGMRCRLLLIFAECFRRSPVENRAAIANLIASVPAPNSTRVRSRVGDLLCSHGLEVSFGSRRRGGLTADDVMRAMELSQASWQAIARISGEALSSSDHTALEAKRFFSELRR
ncbi:MAG: hypothetical protein RL885_05005 [Planctomycetota bacterium]